MRWLFLIAFLGADASLAVAQGVHGSITDRTSGQSIAGVLIQVFDSSGVRRGAALTDSAGRYLVPLIRGAWALRFERVGYEPVRRQITINDNLWQDVALTLVPRALAIQKLEVTTKPRCGDPGQSPGALHELWTEVKKGLEAVDWAIKNDRRNVHLTEVRTIDLSSDLSPRYSTATTAQVRARSVVPFDVIAPESAAVHGFARIYRDSSVWYGPDAGVLLSQAFLDTHCFSIVRLKNRLGLGFRPVTDPLSTIDIRGVVWLDSTATNLQSTDFSYSSRDMRMPVDSAKGHVAFALNRRGELTVKNWELRIPHLRFEEDSPATFHIVGYRRTTGLLLDDSKGSAELRGSHPSVQGKVLDAAGAPLAGALVRLVDTPFSTRSGADGTYALHDIPPGEYTITFLYPQPPDRARLVPSRKRVRVRASEVTTVDLTYDQ